MAMAAHRGKRAIGGPKHQIGSMVSLEMLQAIDATDHLVLCCDDDRASRIRALLGIALTAYERSRQPSEVV